MAPPSLNTYLRTHMRDNELMARLATNKGDHLEALVRLTRAEAFARAAYLYQTVRKHGHAEASRQKSEETRFAVQAELVRELLEKQNGLETGEPGDVEVLNGHYGRVPEPREPRITAADLQLLVSSKP